MAIIGHSKFIPVFLGNIVRKRLEQTFLAIPNLYQSFWEKLLEKIWNNHFWPFLIYTSLFGKNCWKKFGTTIFGHSKFIPVFLGKIARKKLEQPYLAKISLLGKICWKKFRMAIPNFTSLLEKNSIPFQFIPVLLGNIVRKRLGQAMAIPNLYQSSWEKLLEINKEWPFLPFQILYQSFWEKLSEKDWNNHFWPFQIYTSPSGKHCWKKIATNIFGHS